MDFLKAEIERKRKQIQEKNVLQPDKKYFKRGDLAAVQEAEYLAKYGPKIDDIAGRLIIVYWWQGLVLTFTSPILVIQYVRILMPMQIIL